MTDTGAKLAKAVRVITVPPAIIGILFVILWFACNQLFNGVIQLLLSILFLSVIPLLAYPLAHMLPEHKNDVRGAERKVAFVLSPLGYLGAIIYGLCAHAGKGLMTIYLTYFISVCLLLLFNKVIKIKASGHACSMSGPLILTVYFIGWIYIIPCAVIYAAVIWSSLKLKRHTPRELILGTAAAFIAFAVSLLLI